MLNCDESSAKLGSIEKAGVSQEDKDLSTSYSSFLLKIAESRSPKA